MNACKTNEWDDHTQQIVTLRTHPIAGYQFLNEQEVEILRILCSLLVNDDSADSLEFVIGHFDQTLYSSPGEEQRKAGVPTAPELIRKGLKSVEQTSQHKYSISFTELNTEQQKQLIQDISAARMEPTVRNRLCGSGLSARICAYTARTIGSMGGKGGK